jgi:nitrate/TMAO reductase-like tetraheme cytochrome c subunit
MRIVLALTIALTAGAALGGELKNLQVLPKTTTKEQVKAIMKAQAKALDVECDHCHDVPDMASDANAKKKIAREMMKMTAEINNRWLKGIKQPVTCGTCHRGKAEPTPFN